MAYVLVRGLRSFLFDVGKGFLPNKGGNLAIFFCCMQVVCVVSLTPWGAIAKLKVSLDTINQLGGLA